VRLSNSLLGFVMARSNLQIQFLETEVKIIHYKSALPHVLEFPE
jgi:hypothetical protein